MRAIEASPMWQSQARTGHEEAADSLLATRFEIERFAGWPDFRITASVRQFPSTVDGWKRWGARLLRTCSERNKLVGCRIVMPDPIPVVYLTEQQSADLSTVVMIVVDRRPSFVKGST